MKVNIYAHLYEQDKNLPKHLRLRLYATAQRVAFFKITLSAFDSREADRRL